MPILKDFRTTKVIDLASMPDSKIEIYDGFLYKHSGLLKKTKENPDDTDALVAALCAIIKGWNFTSEDGSALPVSVDAIYMLKPEAINELAQAVLTFVEGEKKTV